MHSLTRHRRTLLVLVAALAAIAGPATPVAAVPSLIPTVATAIRNSAGTTVTTVNVGTTVHAYVAVSGSGGVPTGTVTVRVWRTNGTCSGTASAQLTQSLVNGAADATYLTQTTDDASTASFRAQYNGNGTYFIGVGPCRSVSFAKVSPEVLVRLKDPNGIAQTSVGFGIPLHAYVDVSGTAGAATGTAGVTAWTGPGCTGTASPHGTGTLVSGEADTGYVFTASLPGTYWFSGFYNGDSSYLARTGACVALTVGRAKPTFTVQLRNRFDQPATSTEAMGEPVHAAVTMSGSIGFPTGIITIDRYPNINCSGTAEYEGTVAANISVDPAGQAYDPNAPSTHSWRLTYSGDSKYISRIGPCMAITWKGYAPIVLDLRTPSGTAVTSAPVGTDVHARISLASKFGTPTGTVTVESWAASANCAGDGVSIGTGSLVGGVVDDASIDLVLSQAASYSFKASYGGNGTFLPSQSDCVTVVATSTPDPTPKPTVAPTPKPTIAPTPKPTSAPSAGPSAAPTAAATTGAGSTPAPSAAPSTGAAASATPGATDQVAAAGGTSPTDGPATVGGAGDVSPAEDAAGLPVALWIGILLVLLVALAIGLAIGRRRRRAASGAAAGG
ncbi:MAG TPA: hypothetical protein VF484_08080 [Candidatus Limnocylindrales bacterium]